MRSGYQGPANEDPGAPGPLTSPAFGSYTVPATYPGLDPYSGCATYPGLDPYSGCQVSRPADNTTGTLAMVFGILSIPMSFVGLPGITGIALGLAAIVLGVRGLRKVRQGLASNRGMAMAGVVCGPFGLVLGTAVAVVIIYVNFFAP